MEARPFVESLRQAIAASGFVCEDQDPDKKPEHAPEPGRTSP